MCIFVLWIFLILFFYQNVVDDCFYWSILGSVLKDGMLALRFCKYKCSLESIYFKALEFNIKKNHSLCSGEVLDWNNRIKTSWWAIVYFIYLFFVTLLENKSGIIQKRKITILASAPVYFELVHLLSVALNAPASRSPVDCDWL